MLTSIVVALSLAFSPIAVHGRHGAAKSKTVHVKASKAKSKHKHS